MARRQLEQRKARRKLLRPRRPASEARSGNLTMIFHGSVKKAVEVENVNGPQINIF